MPTRYIWRLRVNTIEQRRTTLIKWLRQKVGENQMNYKDVEVAIAALEELWSMSDAWTSCAIALEDMAKVQREQFEFQKRFVIIPAKSEGNG
jgi:hypothetical protein